MISKDLKAIVLSGTLMLSLSSANMATDTSFNLVNSYANFESVKSSSNDYETLGDSSSDVYKVENIYNLRKDSGGIIQNSVDLFGDMRNLTKEEENSYAKGLAEMSESTGVTLF